MNKIVDNLSEKIELILARFKGGDHTLQETKGKIMGLFNGVITIDEVRKLFSQMYVDLPDDDDELFDVAKEMIKESKKEIIVIDKQAPSNKETKESSSKQQDPAI